ncbi:amino acid ABC transporter permease [Pseudovibrio exalbescens]|uniref:Amino acid ABC transporter permease n=1 Tax=Pseudovibrio exalbescens TaxID=197461 RepID=A0A1U7JFZ8_9HYPH|nr:ABC transporter permease subunit [Pseudovibrio exalbescens]OKL43612.1 amino acid ABC transporter permease [Pseudovibrio exalbescens]
MSVATYSPEERFRLGMLWTDSRYRSTTIQTIALFLVMLLGAYLINNIITNLADLGKDFSFGFLFEPAYYDINQRLIEYDSRSPHWLAAVVGILNTLLVAVLGCALATVIGVIAGVLRLSKNWVISKLMAVYIEVVRNVPLLLQILLLYAVFIELLPRPRGSEPMLDGFLVATNRGFYIPSLVLAETGWIVVSTFVVSLVGIFLFRRWARKRQEETGQIIRVFSISLGILIVPTAIVFFALGSPISLEYPELKGFNYQGGIHLRNSLVALWLALSIYTGAFIGEIVRSGIQAINKGQTEAAYALGLRPNRTMKLVILPQALRVIIPPLISQYLNLTKNSSLAIAVGYMDVTGTLGGITLNQTGREMECVLLLMAFYLTVSLLISAVMNKYNQSVKLKER